MRVVVDVTSSIKGHRGGIANYAIELVRGMARVAPEHELVLAIRNNRWLRRALVDDVLPDAPRRLLVDGLSWATLGKVDVFHACGVRLPAGARFPKVVMMHDLNVFEFPELSKESWLAKRRARILQTIQRADLILSYSRQGVEALAEHVGVGPERVRVVPLGVDMERFRRPDDAVLADVLARHELTDTPYVVMVGEYSTRKNPHGLLEAFVRAELPAPWTLVLGGPRKDDAAALAEHAAELGLAPERLRLPGFVSDDDLAPLIAGAAFYVCSSLHEGFGLPVVEAQSCGIAVASSDRGALPETLGDCGLLFDPEDVDAFAGAIRRLADDETLRAELASRGRARVADRYTWDHVARNTLDVLTEAVALRA